MPNAAGLGNLRRAGAAPRAVGSWDVRAGGGGSVSAFRAASARLACTGAGGGAIGGLGAGAQPGWTVPVTGYASWRP
jgi:hypothetical protein